MSPGLAGGKQLWVCPAGCPVWTMVPVSHLPAVAGAACRHRAVGGTARWLAPGQRTDLACPGTATREGFRGHSL